MALSKTQKRNLIKWMAQEPLTPERSTLLMLLRSNASDADKLSTMERMLSERMTARADETEPYVLEIPCLSCNHLPKEDDAILKDDRNNDVLAFANQHSALGTTGYIVMLGEKEDADVRFACYTESTRNLFRFYLALGYKMLRFDSIYAPLNNHPVFDW